MFVQRVKEKEAELKEAEKEVPTTAVLCSSFIFVQGSSCSLPTWRLNVFYLCLSYMRSLTVWRSSTRKRKRSWRRKESHSTTSSTCSNRKRLPQSSCKTKHSRQGAPPHSRGIRRGKSKYYSFPCIFSCHPFYIRVRRPLVVQGSVKFGCTNSVKGRATQYFINAARCCFCQCSFSSVIIFSSQSYVTN